MKHESTKMKMIGLLGAVSLCTLLLIGAAQQPTVDERVAAIKQSLQKSMKQIRLYQWTETTTVSLKGEEKSRTQNYCSYGADGKLQKTPVAPPAEKKDKRGVRGKVIENKTEELSEYMTSAVGLIKSYVPPDPAKIQASKDAGKASVQVIEPGKRARVEFRDYNLAGDMLGIEVDLTNNHILGLQVSTYLTEPSDAVDLNVRFTTLEDGTGYPAEVVLDAKVKQVKVNVQNSDHKLGT